MPAATAVSLTQVVGRLALPAAIAVALASVTDSNLAWRGYLTFKAVEAWQVIEAPLHCSTPVVVQAAAHRYRQALASPTLKALTAGNADLPDLPAPLPVGGPQVL